MRVISRAVALSVIFLGSAAYAQSSVKIYGAIDAGVSWISNQSGHGKLKYDDGIYTPNLFGFQGSEDLGTGLSAIFKLEGAFKNGTGESIPGIGMFGRHSYVGLKDAQYGTLTLGNQFDFMFDSISMQNNNPAIFTGGLYAMSAGPFTRLGIPANPTGNFAWDRLGGQAVANSIKYQSPGLGDFSFGAMYAFGEAPGHFSEGDTKSFGLNYRRGAFGIGAAYTEQKYAKATPGGDSVAVRNWGIGSHYQFEKLVANALITSVHNAANGAGIYAVSAGVNWTIDNSWLLGSNYVYMKGNENLANHHAHQAAATLSYLFSKRTRIYVQGVYQRANSGANALINGITEPGGASSSPKQAIARIGIQTFY